MTTVAPSLDLARRVRELHGDDVLHTPCLRVPELDLAPDLPVWLKLESLQHTGSFKWRGALGALRYALDGSEAQALREHGVWTASAGNHGRALAHAASRVGVPCRVFVPASAPEVKVRGMRDAGATVVRCEAEGYDACAALAERETAGSPERFVSAFDDPVVAAGNGGTLTLEVLEDVPDMRSLVLPVGGGGLLAGAAAVTTETASRASLFGVNAARSDALVQSLDSGEARTTMPPATTLADGLEGGIGARTFGWAKHAVRAATAVDEDVIADAMRELGDLGLVVEGSAAVALAGARRLVHAGGETRPEPGPCVLVLTGRNVDRAVWRSLWA